MSGVLDPALRVKALQEIAQKIGPGAQFGVSVYWGDEKRSAGIALYDKECVVVLRDARQPVESLAHATDMLQRIFADEAVAVRAYAQDTFVHVGLAPKNEPSVGFQTIVAHGKDLRFPQIDRIETASWSHGYEDEPE